MKRTGAILTILTMIFMLLFGTASAYTPGEYTATAQGNNGPVEVSTWMQTASPQWKSSSTAKPGIFETVFDTLRNRL